MIESRLCSLELKCYFSLFACGKNNIKHHHTPLSTFLRRIVESIDKFNNEGLN